MKQFDLGPFGMVLSTGYVDFTFCGPTHNWGVSFSCRTYGHFWRSLRRWFRGEYRWGARGNGLPKILVWRVKQLTDEDFAAAYPESSE